MLAKLSKRLKISTAQFAILLISFQCCFSAPVENIYVKFINDLNSNKCATPEQIKLPTNSTLEENVEFLSSSLKICQNLDTVGRIKEAQFLCREIFDNLKIVLCPNTKGTIKPLNITFSKQVCKDIASLKNVSDDTFLLKHLTDNWSCEMLCDAAFERSCQVLLWSYTEKKDFKESENIKSKVIAVSPQQENVPSSDLQKFDEPNKAKENANQITQEQTKNTAQLATNTFVLGTKKINSLLEQVQNEADKLQANLDSNKNSLPIIPNTDGTNSILSVIQNNKIKNVSQNVSLNPPKKDVINSNDLPDNTKLLVSEVEDPHDNEDVFHHDEEPDVNDNKELAQHPNNQSPIIPANIDLPKPPVNIEDPNIAVNKESQPLSPNDLSPAVNAELPQINPNVDFVDPHDGEETGDEESPSTNPKVTVGQTQTIKADINPGEANVQPQTKPVINPKEANIQAQAKPVTTQNSSSTIKATAGSSSTAKAVSTTTKIVPSTAKAVPSTGSTKSSASTAEKKYSEIKSLTSEKVSSVSADSQKTTQGLSLLPSLKDTSSSVVSPTSEDLSPSFADIEKMEGGDDAHEMPEDREQYTDLEKTAGDADDDYARQEYDGIYEPAKNKETAPVKANEVPKVDESQREQTFEEFSPRSKYGPDDVPLIPVVFPEQEDGHFFFYFLSMVLILMAGYLIFHNKQKIIALIVEGRHERRRRSHGAGYKKLETK